MRMNETEYDRIVIEFLKYQGHSKIAEEYIEEKKFPPEKDTLCELRSQVRKFISDGKYEEMKERLIEYNFEIITSTKIEDFISRQRAIECLDKDEFEQALAFLQNLRINVDDLLEKIVYQKKIDVKESKDVTAEIINQIIMFEFGVSKNVIVEVVEKLGVSKVLAFFSLEKKND